MAMARTPRILLPVGERGIIGKMSDGPSHTSQNPGTVRHTAHADAIAVNTPKLTVRERLNAGRSSLSLPHLYSLGLSQVRARGKGAHPNAMVIRNSALVLTFFRRDFISSMASTTFISDRTLRRR